MAIRSPRDPDLQCWSKRGERVCQLHRGHLCMHRNGLLKWTDVEYVEDVRDVDTGGKL